MSLNHSENKWREKRSQERKRVNKLYRVRLSIDKFSTTYQFRLWERTPKSLSFFVDEKPPFLLKLKKKEKIQIIYRPKDSSYPCVFVKGRIRHITSSAEGQSNGQYLIGLEILERNDSGLKGDTVYSLLDNGGRRTNLDRRRFTYTEHIPERRYGKVRRMQKDRRNWILPVNNDEIEKIKIPRSTMIGLSIEIFATHALLN